MPIYKPVNWHFIKLDLRQEVLMRFYANQGKKISGMTEFSYIMVCHVFPAYNLNEVATDD